MHTTQKAIKRQWQRRGAVIAKYLNKSSNEFFLHEVTNEIADVIITIRQMCFIWRIEDSDILTAVEFKLNRQIKRMKGKKNESNC